MAKVPKRIGHGEGGSRVPKLEQLFDGQIDDMSMLRDALIDLLKKLDADDGVTDEDYEAELTPDELDSQKSDS